MKRIISILSMSLALMPALSAQNTAVRFLHQYTDVVLEDGVHYAIRTDSLYIDRKDWDLVSPLSVEPGSLAIIELRGGQKIIAKGSDGQRNAFNQSAQRQGYPGILIPEGAVLIVYGNGEIIAEGGDAGKGSIGGNGGNGTMDDSSISRGAGGFGGIGGGGGAPGIGAPGGIGGAGGARPEVAKVEVSMTEGYSVMPTKGNSGFDGHEGCGMGDIYVIGNIKVSAKAGKLSNFVYEHSSHGAGLNYYSSSGFFLARDFFRLGYGGGGGNGGGGDAARYDIGGGAPGSGGGGSGGSGGYMSAIVRDKLRFMSGEGGKGGNSITDSISGRHGEGILYYSEGAGGKGGNPGSAYGGNGRIHLTENVLLDCSYDAESVETVTDLSMLPEKVRPLLVRIITGAEWEGGDDKIEAFVGSEMPDTRIGIPVDETKGTFLGYYDQYGKMVYDAQGNMAIDIDDHSCNFVPGTGEKAGHWYVNSTDTVRLTPAWSGVRSVFVVRYLENPNFSGYKTAIERYTTGSVITEQMYVPKTEQTATIAVYPDGYNGIDSSLYSCRDTEDNFLTIGLEDADEAVTVTLYYDKAHFNLTWEGLDDAMLSRRCRNLSGYTRSGSYPSGKEIVFPDLIQAEGSALSHWERRTADNEYVPFDETVLPAENIVLRPVFKQVTFKACTEVEGNGRVLLDMGDGEPAADLTDIAYHRQVRVTAVADTLCICGSIRVTGAETQREIELTEEGDVTTFLMPDEDVTVRAVFEYHPFHTLQMSKNGGNEIRYYVTKDWNTFYTDDNDFYHFDDSQLAGRIADMKYGTGDFFHIHTDYDYLYGEGSREPKVYVTKGNGGEMLAELKRSTVGYGDSALTFFTVTVNEEMSASDVFMHIVWSEPRTEFRVNAYDNERTGFLEMYSGSYDISGTGIAYAGDLITFKLESDDPDFDHSNILIEYKSGTDTRNMNVSKSEDGQHYAFVMPESDVEISLIEGTRHSIIAECDNDSVFILAPSTGIAGYPVTFSIFFLSESVGVEEAAGYVVFVNGEPAVSIPYSFEKTFIMPDEDVVLSFNGKGDVDNVQPAYKDGNPSADVFNVLGQKIGNLHNLSLDRIPAGVVIVNGKKRIIR